jgi:hypothetical protein
MIDKDWQKVILFVSAAIITIGAIRLLGWLVAGPSGMAVSDVETSKQSDFMMFWGTIIFLAVVIMTVRAYSSIEGQK